MDVRKVRQSVWILILGMVLSLLVVPPGKADAADGGNTDISGKTSDKVTAELISTGTNNEYWREFNYSVTNGLDTPICGIKIKVPVTGTVGDVQAYNCSARYSEGYIVISHSAVLAAGTTYTCPDDAKFGFGGSATLGTPIVEFVEGEDCGGTSGSKLDYELTGQTKNIPIEETPFGKHGKLRLAEVEGYTAPIIVDKNGNPFQLRGASTHGMHWDAMHPYVNKASFQSLRDEWGVNMVRLVSYVTQGGYTGDGKDLLDQKIQEGVQAATDLGMYVIIDWHIHGESPIPTKSSAETFFAKYAQMYKNYDNVIFEICNEPLDIVWYNEGTDNLYSYCKDIVKIIRDNGSDALIVCGTNTYSQDVDDVSKKPLKNDGYDNILYTFHFYSGSHYDNLMEKVKKATADGTPIFVTEFGVCAANGNGGYDLANADQWIALCDSNNISFCCWSLCNKNESASYLKPDCGKTQGGWVKEDLTTTGIWLVNTYRKHEEAEQDTEYVPENSNLSVSPERINFASLEYGYTEVTAVTVTLSNKGDTEEPVQVSLNMGDSFELTSDAVDSISGNGTAVIKVQPKTGLSVGSYQDKLVIQYGDDGKDSILLPIKVIVEEKANTQKAENPYVIDVSRLSGADAEMYVGTLWENDAAETTVTYDNDRKELTLVKTGKEYTLTGSNPDLTVKVTPGIDRIIMQNAVIGVFEVSDSGNTAQKGDIALALDGSNQITCGGTDAENAGVIMQSGDKLTISGDGGLKIGKIGENSASIVGGTIVLTSGNVTAEGAVVTDALTVNGGFLDVAGGIESNGDIEIKGGKVKAPSIKTDEDSKIVVDPEKAEIVGNFSDIFSKPPVNDKGEEIKDTTEKDTTEKDTTEKDTTEKDTAEKDTTEKDTTEKDTTEKDTTEKDTTEKDTTEKDTTDKDATEKDTTDKAVSDKTAADKIEPEASYMVLIAKVKGAADVSIKSVYKLAVKKTMQIQVNLFNIQKAPIYAVESLSQAGEKTNPKYTFMSSNSAVATVDETGKVTAKKAGNTTITVKAANGLSKTFRLQVMSKPVTKVKITGAKASMKVKGTMKLKAVTSPNKKVASNNIYWKSGNPKIATVDANGKVKALKKGTVKITATVTDGSGKKATVKIKVK